MMSVLIAHWLALLFTFFVVGILLGTLLAKPAQRIARRIIEYVRRTRLSRAHLNPLLKPGRNPWEAEAVFNPAALVLQNRTHLIYRAIGSDGVSRLGYASSKYGIVIDEQLPYPAYTARQPRHAHVPLEPRYAPMLYPSGGSWGGCEDPRMVQIDGTVYVSFHAFDGWDYLRIAIISISAEDFIAKKFQNWRGPTLISPPGQIHKNWVLFPEKINGKFAILHSITPEIEIAYRDSIDSIGVTEPFIESWIGARRGGRKDHWDNNVRGAGPPPIRTDRGWLLLYHAIDDRDPGRYKLGAMLLDLNDPKKVLYRANSPVLSPDSPYENDGKPGIVYACGAVIRNKKLYVYYGGADKVICAATAPLDEFLDALTEGEHAILTGEALQIR